MLRFDLDSLASLESQYPGIIDSIRRFEEAVIPSCPFCNSGDTADVQVGIIGRTINIAAATTKFHLIPNPPKPGNFFCNSCKKYFNAPQT